MTVAITEGVEYIGEMLRERGYNIVHYGSYKNRIDAVVYMGNYLAATQMVSTNFGDGTGVLMINATNKSVDEIDGYLRRKVYFPLLD